MEALLTMVSMARVRVDSVMNTMSTILTAELSTSKLVSRWTCTGPFCRLVAVCSEIKHRPYNYICSCPISGGSSGGVQGVRTPPFGPQCRLFNIGPQSWTPPFVNVQEWGCFSNFLRSDDVTRTMSKGGGCL